MLMLSRTLFQIANEQHFSDASALAPDDVVDVEFLVVGDDVVFGAGVRLNAHVIDGEAGQSVLHLGPVEIGAGARIGGYAVLTAGTVVEAGEHVHAFALCPPFTRWQGGRRSRPAQPR